MPRLFLAAAADDAVKAAAEATLARLKALRADYRWVDPRDMHVTLRYLGPTPDERVPEIRRLMDAAAAATAPLGLVYGGVGAFESLDDPRVVWVGLSEGEPAMRVLAEALGYDEPRPYAAHLTLGRRRRPETAAFRAALRAEPAWALRRRVDRVSLYASRPTSFGHAYEILAESRLRG